MNRSGFRAWITPIVHLANNPLSLIGVVVVTTATIFIIFLAPTLWSGRVDNPYMGIVIFLLLPAIFVAGLVLIPIGIYLRRRKAKLQGVEPAAFPPLDLRNADFRRLLIFVGATTFVNIIIVGQFAYGSVNYMDSVEFCGETCHTVMQPEFTAYQNSPHARVECVKCHIGPGAGWFVRSKLSGVGQVFAVTFNSYPRPIPTPVRNLRPARETCETCHWPQKFGGDRLRILNKFADDETNSRTQTVLLMRIGGGNGTAGIHGVHLGHGVVMRYYPADESRQSIPVVEYNKGDGNWVRFVAADAKPEVVAKATPENMRIMDCMDCHNRPSHTFQLPERALDDAMGGGQVSAALPFAKKEALELLKATYPTHREGVQRIAASFESFYQQKYPAVYGQRTAEVQQSARAVAAIFGRNIFPEMDVKWGSYPNNLGHTDFPGCFRCHDDQHMAKGDRKITQDCSACHSLLAMDEPSPKVLSELGVTHSESGSGAQQ
jgi:hypothetical protein